MHTYQLAWHILIYSFIHPIIQLAKQIKVHYPISECGLKFLYQLDHRVNNQVGIFKTNTWPKINAMFIVILFEAPNVTALMHSVCFRCTYLTVVDLTWSLFLFWPQYSSGIWRVLPFIIGHQKYICYDETILFAPNVITITCYMFSNSHNGTPMCSLEHNI